METREAICRDCGALFVAAHYRGAWQGRCPSCADLAQRRPSVVQDRQLIAGPWNVRIVSLPGPWDPLQPRKRDEASYKIVRKGSYYGASWSGRVDIFANRPYVAGDVVSLAEIVVVHKVCRLSWESGTSIPEGPATVTRSVVIPLPASPEHIGEEIAELQENRPSTQGKDVRAERVVETRTYIRLDEPDSGAEPIGELIWVEASSKITLKGYGRQYKNALRGAPIWKRSIRGGVRSGRAYTMAALAIVNENHPLEVVNVFDR